MQKLREWLQAQDSKTRKPDELQKHISLTYRAIRTLTYALAYAWPVILVGYGRFGFGIETQASMSAYYHTPMRNWFVGMCFVIGVLLIAYRGFSSFENWGLNIAGLFAVLVALFPTGADCDLYYLNCRNERTLVYTNQTVHGAAAVVFFLCCAFVCLWERERTLGGHRHRNFFKVTYTCLGILMFALPILVWAASLFLDMRGWLLLAEWAAVYVFATYWLLKTIEIGERDVDLLRKGFTPDSSA